MNGPPELRERIDRYLSEIRRAIADRPDEVQREICAGLEDQISEAMQRRTAGGREPSAADLDAVLAEMDPPSAFAPTPAETAAARPRGPRGWMWFALALAFLAVNIAGWQRCVSRSAWATLQSAATEDGDPLAAGTEPLVWIFSDDLRADAHPVAFTPEIAGEFTWITPRKLQFRPDHPWPAAHAFQATMASTMRTADGRMLEPSAPFAFTTPPPSLRAVVDAGLTPDREATLRLQFNGTPHLPSLDNRLRLTDQNGNAVKWTVVGAVSSPHVLIRTETIETEELNVRLDPGFRLAGAPIEATEGFSASVSITPRPVLTGVRASSPSFESPILRLEFNQPMDPASAEDFIRIEPAVKTAVSAWSKWWGSGLEFSGNFEPGGLYTVTLREGLPSPSKQVIAQTVTRTVQFPDRQPALEISASGRYFSPASPMRLPVTAVNLRDLKASARPLPASNLAFFALRDADLLSDSYTANESESSASLTERGVQRAYTLPDRPNVVQSLHLDVAELVGSDRRGACLVEIESENARKDSRMVVISDLGLTLKSERHAVSAWVTSLRNAAPLEGVEVTIVSSANQTLARGTTDAEGWIRMTWPPAPDEDAPQPIIAVATLGSDATFLMLPGSDVSLPGASGDAYPDPGGLEAMVYADRGIYRPGETVHTQIIVRGADGAAPSPIPAQLCIIRPDGKTYRDLPLMLNERGAASVSFELPEYLPTGSYTLQATLPGGDPVLGSRNVQLEDFVPPQVAAEWRNVPPSLRAGQPFRAELKARFLFGRDAAGLAMQPSVVFEAQPFSPAGWPGYSFGDYEKSFEPQSRDLARVRLNAEGAHTVEAPTSDAWRPPSALRARMIATVFEPGGRPVYAVADTRIDPYPFYIGLKTDGGRTSVPVGAPLRVAVAAVSPDGSRAGAPGALRAVWSKVSWSHALRRGESGVYHWVSERALSLVHDEVITLQKSEGAVEFTPADSGEYLLVLSDPKSGASSSLSLRALSGAASWMDASREKPDVVEVLADRDNYAPGDLATITIRAPFTGLALLTVERDTVLERRLVPLTNRTATVTLTAGEHWTPNVWCAVSVLRPVEPEEVWSAHRAFGATALAMRPAERKIAVEIKTPATARPREPLPVTLTARDPNGSPIAGAELTVAAVDEGILMLTQYGLPDPWLYFLRLRGPGITHFDLFARLLPVLNEAAAGTALQAGAGGAGDGLLGRRLNPIRGRRFVPVALWKSGLVTDENGTVSVSFDLPEFTGQLRVSAVAFDARRGGGAQTRVTVKRPLVVQPSLPRFLAPEDECDALVSIFNETGADAEISLSIATEGPARMDAHEAILPLTAGASTQWVGHVRADRAAGLSRLTFRASAGSERYEETIELPVRPAHGPSILRYAGEVSSENTFALAPPEDALPGTAYVEVRAGAGPSVRFGNGLSHLLRYPYGCLEQTASGLLPLIRLAPLMAATGPASSAIGDPAELIRSGVLRIVSMQQPDGSFSLWPQSSGCVDWASIYAAHVLAETRRAGYEVPASSMEAAMRYLRARLDAAPPVDAGSGSPSPEWRNDAELRAHACHVLALAGSPAEGWTARLAEQAPLLGYAARLHTALALKHSGHPREAAALLRAAGLPAPRPRSLDGIFSSATRDLALALIAWLETEPGAPETRELERMLIEQSPRGDWGTTQENAWALFALGLRAAQSTEPPPPFSAEFFEPSSPQARPVTPEESLHWRAPAGAPWTAPIRLKNAGPGPLPYSATVEYISTQPPAADPSAASPRLAIRRSALNEAGADLPRDHVFQQGERVVIRLTVDPREHALDQMVITDLLPAGLEPENPNIAASKELSWIPENAGAGHRVEMRDDRILVFSNTFREPLDIYYTARAVTPGRFVWPGARAEAMYDPDVSGTSEAGVCEVRP
ncbi:MAG: hypothetical protein KBA51_06265 [Kiritimatiellae bacterium]|nr:hypothetical protein [Kiritimatiellia bacterium]